MQIKLANPRGFCAGVERAIEIVKRALIRYGSPVYVRHEVVHNRSVVAELRQLGAIFVDDLDEVPASALVIFSAHGVSKQVRRQAEKRKLKVFDATCPLVTKVHAEVIRNAQEGRECILIGHAGHPEVEGTIGQLDARQGGIIHLVENAQDASKLKPVDPDHLSFVTQTTLSVQDTKQVIETLRDRFPNISGPRQDDICYATQNRQDAVVKLAADCDLLLVVGSANSSNSNRLRELAERCGVEAHLIDSEEDIDPSWLYADIVVGVTAGASAPESAVLRIVQRLENLVVASTQELSGTKEELTFSLPRELR